MILPLFLIRGERNRFMNRLFKRADILLPASSVSMEKWSVIACDQHTSEPEYWEKLENFVGDAPSTLKLILPEAFLSKDILSESAKIRSAMQEYLDSGIFRTVDDSFIYVERSLSSGAVRKGLLGVVDLDEYSYSPDSTSRIRATEGTVEDRLPPRVAIRSAAPLELPHIMIFINDPDDLLFKTCSELSKSLESSEALYDFDLSAAGGHITGYRLTGKDADAVDAAIDTITEKVLSNSLSEFPAVLAIGDGNHSLASAKKCGDRYALAEIVNIHDDAIRFEPIHRVLFHTDCSLIGTDLAAAGLSADSICQTADGGVIIRLSGSENYAELIAQTEKFCCSYISAHGGKIDYIHNDDTAAALGSKAGCIAFLLPPLNKAELFDSVAENGPYPKKSFSMGLSDDKRYYLECRRR